MVRAAHFGRDAVASRDRQVRGSSGYLCRADLCRIAASTRHCRERPRGTAARHLYSGLLAHTATPRLGRAAPDVWVSRDLKGGVIRLGHFRFQVEVWLPLAQSRANRREIPGKPAGGSHLELWSGETRGEREAIPPNETAEGVFPTIETAPQGAGFDGGRDALADTQGGWRRGWDSNPRWYRYHAGFQDRCLKPLGHLSAFS